MGECHVERNERVKDIVKYGVKNHVKKGVRKRVARCEGLHATPRWLTP